MGYLCCPLIMKSVKSTATCLPQSSYRLGVKAANLHELFPAHITKALQDSILMFEKEVCIILSFMTSKKVWWFCFLFQLKMQEFLLTSRNCLFQLPGYISKDALLHGVEVCILHSHQTMIFFLLLMLRKRKFATFLFKLNYCIDIIVVYIFFIYPIRCVF